MPFIKTFGSASARGVGLMQNHNKRLIPPNIGEAYKGGYFFGVINSGGTIYELIVAPRPAGFTSLAYSTTAALGGDQSYSLTDGWSNTNVNASGQRPANQWARNLKINGYDDWYIASRDEMELLYRNLKSTTTANTVGSRSYTNQQGDTVFTHGSNVNSIPQGGAYSAGNPGQTAVSIFAAGGEQAFLPEGGTNFNMLTSTRYVGGTNAMMYQGMGNGQQATTTNVTNVIRVRAIRREVRPNYPE